MDQFFVPDADAVAQKRAAARRPESGKRPEPGWRWLVADSILAGFFTAIFAAALILLAVGLTPDSFGDGLGRLIDGDLVAGPAAEGRR